MDKSLFDNQQESGKEAQDLETLKNLDTQISMAVEKIRALKEERAMLERRVRELESLLDEKAEEISRLSSEKNAIKGQIEVLLAELQNIEI